MKNLKIITVAALAGIGAARVLVWLNNGIAAVLLMSNGQWSVEQAAKAAPWILAALVSGLAISLYGMACDNERYESSSNLGKITRNHARNPEYPEHQERGA